MAAGDAALQAARFVASHCGVSEPQPTASTSGGGSSSTVALGSLVGLATVARHLASQSPQASQLLGATPEAQAQVRRRGEARGCRRGLLPSSRGRARPNAPGL